MLQLAHHSKSGVVELVEVPEPVCGSGCVLVRTLASVVSGGTERNTVRVSRGTAIQTAVRRPDLVRRAVNKFDYSQTRIWKVAGSADKAAIAQGDFVGLARAVIAPPFLVKRRIPDLHCRIFMHVTDNPVVLIIAATDTDPAIGDNGHPLDQLIAPFDGHFAG